GAHGFRHERAPHRGCPGGNRTDRPGAGPGGAAPEESGMIEPMATKKPRSKAGTRDLTAAVAKVHTPVKPRVKKEEMTSVPYAKSRLAKAPDELLLAAGDDAEREHFFALDDSGKPRRRTLGKPVHLVLERGAALPDYRTRDGKRNHRTLITIPPKMRQVIQDAFGASDGEDFPFTTALIALAD